MTQVWVTADYTISCNTPIELPEGKTWTDVKEWWVKWDKLYLVFKDNTNESYDIQDADINSVDWKRPSAVVIRPSDENGDEDFSQDELENC